MQTDIASFTLINYPSAETVEVEQNPSVHTKAHIHNAFLRKRVIPMLLWLDMLLLLLRNKLFIRHATVM